MVSKKWKGMSSKEWLFVGTKNVAKSLKKITEGRMRDIGNTWFPELRDKSEFWIEIIFWNCDTILLHQDVVSKYICIGLWRIVREIQWHFAKWYSIFPNIIRYQTSFYWHMFMWVLLQGIHTGCYRASPCRLPNYSTTKTILTDPKAIQFLEKQLKDTYIYRLPEAFCRVRYIVQYLQFNHWHLLHSAVTHTGLKASTINYCVIYQREFILELGYLVWGWTLPLWIG